MFESHEALFYNLLNGHEFHFQKNSWEEKSLDIYFPFRFHAPVEYAFLYLFKFPYTLLFPGEFVCVLLGPTKHLWVRLPGSKSVSQSVRLWVLWTSHAQRADFTVLGVAFLTHWLHLLTPGCTTSLHTYAGIFNGCKDTYLNGSVSVCVWEWASIRICWFSYWLYLLCKWRRLQTLFLLSSFLLCPHPLVVVYVFYFVLSR